MTILKRIVVILFGCCIYNCLLCQEKSHLVVGLRNKVYGVKREEKRNNSGGKLFVCEAADCLSSVSSSATAEERKSRRAAKETFERVFDWQAAQFFSFPSFLCSVYLQIVCAQMESCSLRQIKSMFSETEEQRRKDFGFGFFYRRKLQRFLFFLIGSSPWIQTCYLLSTLCGVSQSDLHGLQLNALF